MDRSIRNLFSLHLKRMLDGDNKKKGAVLAQNEIILLYYIV